MTEWTLLAILCAMMVLGTLTSNSANDFNDQWSRYSWGGMACGLFLAMAMPNPWASLCVASMVTGLYTVRPRSRCYREVVSQGLVWVGAYLAVSQMLALWMLPYLLGAFVLVGCLQGLWCLYSVCVSADLPDGSYNHQLVRGLWVYDRDVLAPLAGQGNFNHGHSIAVLALAANGGLLWMGHTEMVWTLPLVASPLYWLGEYWRPHYHQGWVHLGMLLLGLSVLLLLPRIGLWPVIWMVAAVGILLLWIAKPWSPRLEWIDSKRFWLWKETIAHCWWTAMQPDQPALALEKATMVLRDVQRQWQEVQAQMAEIIQKAVGQPIEWSPETVRLQQTLMAQQQHLTQNIREFGVLAKARAREAMTHEEQDLFTALWVRKWRIRLIGVGTGSFYTVLLPSVLEKFGRYNPDAKRYDSIVFLHAHNEFVEMLVERGVVGLVSLLGLVGTALWGTLLAGPEGQAVFLVLCAWVSIALVNFPLSIFRQYGNEPNPAHQQFMGSPALLTLTFGVAVMAGMFV